MKFIITIASVFIMSSCVDVETDGAAHEAGNLIRDGVKGGIVMYKDYKKGDTLIKEPDTTKFWDKTRNTIKEVKKTIKTIKE